MGWPRSVEHIKTMIMLATSSSRAANRRLKCLQLWAGKSGKQGMQRDGKVMSSYQIAMKAVAEELLKLLFL